MMNYFKAGNNALKHRIMLLIFVSRFLLRVEHICARFSAFSSSDFKSLKRHGSWEKALGGDSLNWLSDLWVELRELVERIGIYFPRVEARVYPDDGCWPLKGTPTPHRGGEQKESKRLRLIVRDGCLLGVGLGGDVRGECVVRAAPCHSALQFYFSLIFLLNRFQTWNTFLDFRNVTVFSCWLKGFGGG